MKKRFLAGRLQHGGDWFTGLLVGSFCGAKISGAGVETTERGSVLMFPDLGNNNSSR
ncbi:hypothetical protein O9993_03060 [Vibrio lentus]|nr:hypothetical protein [Vibrio lentus]